MSTLPDPYDYPLGKEISDGIRSMRESWKNNPSHWTNNKRRRCGFQTLRKQVNRKDRFEPPTYLFRPYADKIDTLIAQMTYDYLPFYLDSFVDVKTFSVGKPYTFSTAMEGGHK